MGFWDKKEVNSVNIECSFLGYDLLYFERESLCLVVIGLYFMSMGGMYLFRG